MKLQHKCDSNSKQATTTTKKTETTTTTTTKAFCFHKGFMLQCAKPNSNQNEILQGNHHQLKISCSKYVVKNPHAPKTKSPQNWFVYMLLWGNQFICYCGMLRTDSHWRILSSSSAFLKKIKLWTQHTCLLGRQTLYVTILNVLPLGHVHSSGAVWELRWPSWAVRPNEPSDFHGRKELLNRTSALVTTCP